jgi:hypothetical protein
MTVGHGISLKNAINYMYTMTEAFTYLFYLLPFLLIGRVSNVFGIYKTRIHFIY